MLRHPLKSTALLGSALLFAPPVIAQDSKALIEALIKKGILNAGEAKAITADLSKQNNNADVSISRGSNLSRLIINGRVQYQFASLSTDVSGTANDPANVNHAFVRRVRVGFRANLAQGWATFINYDFASNNFDAAYVEKIFNPKLTLQAGFKKAPIGYEEYFVSSGDLKSIERSTVTRYFMESNNGRRLGGGKYRQGLWLLGKEGGWTWELAVTNPEATGVSPTNTTGAGNANNNEFAYWGNSGYAGSFDEKKGSFKVGASYGFLPDQGGKTLGVGNDLTVWSIYGDVSHGNFSFVGEYFGSDNDRGASATRDSKSNGYWLQASYRTGDFEPVVRYSFTDSDGRGIQLGDGIRSAASAGTHDTLSEWFVGTNWYLRGTAARHDVKLQAGFLFGESKDVPITGASAKASVDGFRSMLQVNF